MEIGLLGGSFNPVHAGHLMLAQYVAEFTGIDRVWLMLSPLNPLKADNADAPAPNINRLEMLELATYADPNIEPCDIELHMPLPSYTYLTLEKLAEKYPEHRFHLIIGADNWLEFHRWRCADRIIASHPIIVYPRPGYDIDPAGLPESVTLLSGVPVTEISSTFLRRSLAEGKRVSHFMPHGVQEYITNNGQIGRAHV